MLDRRSRRSRALEIASGYCAKRKIIPQAGAARWRHRFVRRLRDNRDAVTVGINDD